MNGLTRFEVGVGANPLAVLDLLACRYASQSAYFPGLSGIGSTVVVAASAFEGLARFTVEVGSVELYAGVAPKLMPLVLGAFGYDMRAAFDPRGGMGFRF